MAEQYEHDCEAEKCSLSLRSRHHYWYLHPREGCKGCPICEALVHKTSATTTKKD